MSDAFRVVVLVSGSGTNLQALIDAQDSFEIVHVFANRPNIKALDRAAAAHIPASVINHKDFDSRAAFDESLRRAVDDLSPDLIVLAGFMRILTPTFLDAFPNRVVNTHPALLPNFPGMHAAKQALEAGVSETGCTVHFVDAGVDTGPVIAQAKVSIRKEDTEDSLQKRIQIEEHRLLPDVVRRLAKDL